MKELLDGTVRAGVSVGILRMPWALLVAVVVLGLVRPGPVASEEISWRPWSDEVLAEARERGRLVLVSGFSSACAWCRKMEADTFEDEELQNLIAESFLPVRVNLRDRDEVPPRFKSLQPPATLVLAADSGELMFHHGYIDARELTSALKGVVDTRHPARKPSSQKGESLPLFALGMNEAAFNVRLAAARRGDRAARLWLEESLRKLEDRYDPTWGGVFNLSDRGSYSKSLSDQILAEWMFLVGREVFDAPKYERYARATARYVMNFLRGDRGLLGEGDEFVSNELSPSEYFRLDDSARRSKGLPRVSSAVSFSGSALMMERMIELYGVTGDQEFRDYAEVIRTALDSEARARKKALSRDDSVAMGRGALSLYSVTADRQFLMMASQVFSSARRLERDSRRAQDVGSERVYFARLALILSRYLGDESLRKEGEVIAIQLGSSVGDQEGDPRIVETLVEARSEPLHIVVVGPKGDARARDLWSEAIRLVHPYLRREWWDRGEGPLPNPDVSYPSFARPAAFLCFEKRCSLPLFTESELRAKLREVVPPL